MTLSKKITDGIEEFVREQLHEHDADPLQSEVLTEDGLTKYLVEMFTYRPGKAMVKNFLCATCLTPLVSEEKRECCRDLLEDLKRWAVERQDADL
jgi:hypothetical protein